MTLRGLLLAAWDMTRADRWRATLSAIGIVIGVIAICAVAAVGEIARDAMVAEIERTSGRAATLELSLEAERSDPRAAWDDVAAQLASPMAGRHVRSGSALFALVGTVAEGAFGPPTQVTVMGVDDSYLDVRRLRIRAGRWLRASDASVGGVVAVVNTSLAEAVGLPSEGAGVWQGVLAIDRPVGISVVGIVEDGMTEPAAYGLWRDVADWVDVSLDAAAPRYLIHVDPGTWPLAARMLAYQLETALGQEPSVRRVDNVDEVRRLVGIAQLSIGAVGMLAVVIGVIGIVNVGLATVRERSQELAVRRSFGASSRDVFHLMLLQSSLVGVLSGAVGVVLTIAGTVLFVRLLDLPVEAGTARFPAWVAALGIGVGAAASVVGGLAPARRATRMSVMDAIRR